MDIKKFDGCKVKSVQFSTIDMLSRFFTVNGEGFTKTGESTCIDDYTQIPIRVERNTTVWIKDKS